MLEVRRATVALLLLVALLLSSAIPASADADSVFKPMIILVGDSITERGFEDGGWGLLLSQDYNRKADVLNRGFGGYNSRMGIYVLDEFLNSFGGSGRIKLVTLGFGSNDAQSSTSPAGFLHVPLEEYKANLIAMVRKLRSKGVNNIVIITPPPANQDVSQRLWAAQRDTKPYAAAAIAVANSLKVPYVDLYAAFTAAKGWQDTALKSDGLHLTLSGNRIMYDAVISVIDRALKSVSPSVLPWHMPDYRRVNIQQPGYTFNSLYGYKVQTGVQLPPAAPPVAPPAAAATASRAKAAAGTSAPAAAALPQPAAAAAAVAATAPRQTPICKGKALPGAAKDKAGRQWGYENGASCIYAVAAAAIGAHPAVPAAAAVQAVTATPAAAIRKEAAAGERSPPKVQPESKATSTTASSKPSAAPAAAVAAPAPAAAAPRASKPVVSSVVTSTKAVAAAPAAAAAPVASEQTPRSRLAG